MAKRAKFPWELKKLTYAEWGNLDFDWVNQSKINKWIPSYFFRYENYHKGLENEYIMKRMHPAAIIPGVLVGIMVIVGCIFKGYMGW